jgi:hypothetical protein
LTGTALILADAQFNPLAVGDLTQYLLYNLGNVEAHFTAVSFSLNQDHNQFSHPVQIL